MKYIVNIIWDPEAEVWIAESDDIPGLVLESGSFDALLTKVQYAAPELIQMNRMNLPESIQFHSLPFERTAF